MNYGDWRSKELLSQLSAPTGLHLVPVLKANGNTRLCGDYKITISKYTQKDVYSLPRVEDLFAALGGGVVFSKIDLTSAYQQMPLDEESKSTQSSIHIKDYFVMNDYLSEYQPFH